MVKINPWKKKGEDKPEEANNSSERAYGSDYQDWDEDGGDYPSRRLRDLDEISPFRSIFSGSEDFDFGFERIERQMDAIFRKALEGNLGKPGEGGPFVYGYTIKTGPDGKPQVREFGNYDIKVGRKITNLPARINIEPENSCPTCKSTSELPTRNVRGASEVEYFGSEPLTDMIECDDSISVTIELPGVQKDDIELHVTPENLVVEVDTPEKKYYKEFTLPCEVKPDKIHATYKNSVLDITIKRKNRRKKTKRGKKVKIE
jgi:HSP20 family protein